MQNLMQQKTVLITGGTGGIGKQTALALAKMGATVLVSGRDQASGQAAVSQIIQDSGNQKIHLLLADLSVQRGVRSLADQVKQQFGQLDVLINNAGLAAPERRLTEDGIEADFAVNVIAPFLLTHLLIENIKMSSAARVVNVTGGDHPAAIDLDNIQAERSFIGLSTYSHAKVMMIAVMYEFSQRMVGTQICINVCYPGQASTNMTQQVTPKMLPPAARVIWPLFKLMTRPDDGRSAAKAAQSSIFLASNSTVEGVTGRYYNTKSAVVPWPAAALDQPIRQNLYTMVEQFAGITTAATLP